MTTVVVEGALWLEEDVIDIGGASALQDLIRKELKPHIEARVVVTSTLMEKQSSAPPCLAAGHRPPLDAYREARAGREAVDEALSAPAR